MRREIKIMGVLGLLSILLFFFLQDSFSSSSNSSKSLIVEQKPTNSIPNLSEQGKNEVVRNLFRDIVSEKKEIDSVKERGAVEAREGEENEKIDNKEEYSEERISEEKEEGGDIEEENEKHEEHEEHEQHEENREHGEHGEHEEHEEREEEGKGKDGELEGKKRIRKVAERKELSPKIKEMFPRGWDEKCSFMLDQNTMFFFLFSSLLFSSLAIFSQILTLLPLNFYEKKGTR